ncbi:MAG TPA: Hsp20/alpha crystallin family protein [Terriglobales bacterium]|nr:Hsp20/alpha crystallin family protein [Terriglobales bacterium]
MTFVTRWDPFREMTNLQSTLNRILSQDNAQSGDDLMTSGTFTPPVDIYEDEHSIKLHVEVPGLSEKDIDIRLENNTLTLRGERKFESEQKEENFRRVERRYGSFVRSFTLPNTVDTENVSAQCENGVLNIQLAKKAEAKPKQIKVNIGTAPKQVKGTGQAA